MLGFLPPVVRGVIAFLLLLLNTVFWCVPLYLLALVRLVLPLKAVRVRIDPWLNEIATRWIAGNSGWMRLTQRTEWDVEGVAKLPYRGWYLVNCNHQSWVDIFVLQHVMNRHIPLLKFFLKQELIWVPVIGLAWWALDFPFMRRYSRKLLEKRPHLKGKDIETTRKACAKFRHMPVSVMNFVEGTRFTAHKHDKQGAPYRHLLHPRAGGIAFTLAAMGDQLHKLVDVTIAYPGGIPSYWDFMCGRVKEIKVRVRFLPIERNLVGDYFNDPEFQQEFQQWLNGIWHEKDQTLDKLLADKTQ